MASALVAISDLTSVGEGGGGYAEFGFPGLVSLIYYHPI